MLFNSEHIQNSPFPQKNTKSFIEWSGRSGRKDGGGQKIIHSCVCLLCSRHWEFKDEQENVSIFEELTKIVL